jgi:hypothetical protein
MSGSVGWRFPRGGFGYVWASNTGFVGTEAISVINPRSPSHGLPDGGIIPELYVPFIPEIEGSVVPSVDVTRGAAETGDGSMTRLEEPPPAHGFLTYAFITFVPGGAPSGGGNATIFASPLNLLYVIIGPGLPPTTAVHELSDAQAAFASSTDKYVPAASRHAF